MVANSRRKRTPWLTYGCAILVGAAAHRVLSAHITSPRVHFAHQAIAEEGERPRDATEGAYDIRRGAAGYAQIIATFGALAVPTIYIVLEGARRAPEGSAEPGTALALGLLVTALLGSLGGSMSMAALGAERRLTGNLAAGTMWAGSGVVVAMTSLIGAFAASAVGVAPSPVESLFRLLVSGAGVFGVVFVAFAVADSWILGPRDYPTRMAWRRDQWISSRTKANRESWKVTLVGVVPIGVGTVLHYAGVVPSAVVPEGAVVAAGLVLVLVATVRAAMWTRHTEGIQRSLGVSTAYGTVLIASCYVLLVLYALPVGVPPTR